MLDMNAVYDLIPKIYLRAMTFEFKLGEGIKDYFEREVAWSILNDNGEPLIPEVAFIIVQEWRKLMFINAVEIMHLKKKGKMDKDHNVRWGKRGWWF